MVRKEEIVVWFSRQPSHQRLDVLCTLASICLPLELRFLNTCVDFLARNKTPSARDAEILAALEKNCLQLNEVDLHDEGSRRKLILALTLLHAGNRIVAHTIYRILCSTCSDLKMFGPDITFESSLELNLIFTMALHHPSFTFEEKVKLGDIYLCMQSRLPGLRPTSDSVSPVPTSTPSPQPQSSPPDISERSLNNGSNSSSSSSSSHNSTNSNSRIKTGQNDRSTIRRNRNSPKSNGSANLDSVTTQLKEQLGKDRLPKHWRQFEHLNSTELMNCSDQEFLSCGLSPNFISHLRKVLNQCHHKSNGGLAIPNEEAKVVQQVNNSKSTASTAATRPSLVKTCMGPPNVQPAFNNSQRIATTPIENQPSQQQQHYQQQQQHQHYQQQQHHHQQQNHQQQLQQDSLTNRAGSSSSSGSSSLETCSPPSSPTDSSSTAPRDNHRKHYAVPQTVMVLNPGTRPQTRLPNSGTVANASLRGANNIGFPRPMGATNTNSGGPMRQQQQQISTTASRGASQPREMSFPVSLSYAVQPAQQQQKQVVQPSSTQVQGTSFIVDSSTPPPHLEAQAAGVAQQQTQQPAQSPAPTLSVYSYQYLHLPNGDGTQPFPQHPFTFITSGPPPNSAGLPGNTRAPGPHDMIYSPQSYVGQIVAQPLGSHHGSSAANGRPSLMEIPYLPPLFMARSDQGGATDYSRPPPPGSQSSAGGPSPIPGNNSCFNCGASGHRGTQCQQITFDEIINPSPV